MQGANPCPQSRENFMAKTKQSEQKKKDGEARQKLMVVFEQYKEGPEDEDVPDEDDPKQKINRDKRGRPTVMTKQTLGKLRDAFRFGCTDEEAAFYAGIHVDSIYAYIEKHPEFSEEKEQLKMTPILAARRNIVTDIFLGATPDSWQYIRAKRKKEFAEMKQHEVTTKTLTEADIEAAEAEQFATMEAITEDEQVTA